MPDVLLDAGCLAWGRTTGWERYTRSLVMALDAHDHGLAVEVVECPTRVPRHRWEQVELPRIASSNRRAMVHCPGPPPSPFIRNRTLTTIHDATAFFHPEWSSRLGRTYYRRLYRRQIGRASAWQLTPTAAARNDLLLCGYAPNRVKVAHPSAHDFSGVSVEAVRGVVQPFVLFVGTLEPRKNLRTLLSAWEQTRVSAFNQLVIAGRTGWGPMLETPAGVTLTGPVKESQLLWLYRHCAVLVLPSLYEGFGLTTAEAALQGARLLVSDIPACREVNGVEASYINPRDPIAMARGLDDALDPSRCPPSPPSKNRFTSERFAFEVCSAYRQVLNGS